MDWTTEEVWARRRVRHRDGDLGTIVEVRVAEEGWFMGSLYPRRIYARIKWDCQAEASVGFYSAAGADQLEPADGA